MKPILAAAILGGLAVATAANATPINYTFSVTANSGPLSGTTAAGTFSYDSSSITPGGSNGNAGSLTSLNFTWNGIHYDQTTANTGFLGFNAGGNLAFATFGNNCSASICDNANPNDWFVSWPTLFAYGGTFGGSGTATLSLVAAPEPSTLAVLGIAGAMLMGARVLPRGRREAE